MERRSRTRWSVAGAGTLASVLLYPTICNADAEGDLTRSLKKLSVEELLDLEVTSVSKRPEKWLDAPAAIQVITADDIRRAGVRSLPETLRLTNNLDVARQNSHQWV